MIETIGAENKDYFENDGLQAIEQAVGVMDINQVMLKKQLENLENLEIPRYEYWLDLILMAHKFTMAIDGVCVLILLTFELNNGNDPMILVVAVAVTTSLSIAAAITNKYYKKYLDAKYLEQTEIKGKLGQISLEMNNVISELQDLEVGRNKIDYAQQELAQLTDDQLVANL
jgi:hypothetical protein